MEYANLTMVGVAELFPGVRKKAGVIGLMLLSGCGTILQEGLEEREANEIIMVLSESGVPAQKISQGGRSERAFAVKVASEHLSKAWRLIQIAGLPRLQHKGFMSVYKERGLVPGRMEEHALFLSALQEEIAKTLESIEGVISARVHTNIRPAGKLIKVKPSDLMASVLICYHAESSGSPPISSQAIRKIVAHAVEGLQEQNVAVVFTPRSHIMRPEPILSSSREGNSFTKVASASVAGLMLCMAAGFAWHKHRRRKFIRSSVRRAKRLRRTS